ncbi:Homeobox protein HD-3 [Astathelohania contejeani]|uniref:Homeobox protein HD-3 n=1 Tax=Astathelohania contejeani TaxID=164912 RepID=A0ABQ7HZN7_9MICR|nr:Homeobox protein HD-3 [Thelohania contejeani]
MQIAFMGQQDDYKIQNRTETNAIGDYKKRQRTVMTPGQSQILKKYFNINNFPSTEVREELARNLGVKPRTIQIWFQNQRQKNKIRGEDFKHENYNAYMYSKLDVLAEIALVKSHERGMSKDNYNFEGNQLSSKQK